MDDKQQEFIKMYELLCKKYGLTLVPIAKTAVGDDGRIVVKAENVIAKLT